MMSTAPVSGGTRAARGALAALLAVGSAALAHAAAGHHHPHWVVLVLSLTISLPLCTALSTVRLSRSRLAATASRPSRPPHRVPVGRSVVVEELWLGAGPRTVRGPPILTN